MTQAITPQQDYNASPLDVPLLFTVLVLLGFGLVMVASTSVEYSQAHYGTWWALMWRHAWHIVIAMLCAWIVFMIPLHFWYKVAPFLFPLGLIALTLVLFRGLGTEAGGARRWLYIGNIGIQPSELVKLLSMMYLASFLAHEPRVTRTANISKQYVSPIGWFIVLSCLLLAEPDMGAFVLLLSCGMIVLFLSGLRLRVFMGLGIAAGIVCALLIVLSPYRWQRVTAFIDPWQDVAGSGYQLTHALSAFGSGGWWGVGLGHSIQKQFYLPAAHTDFIFAVIAEEFGWFGVVCVIGLFSYLVARIWRVATIARRKEHVFTMYLVYGLALLIAIQTFINLGVNLGVLPTKGITLPFVSYGGSSLLSGCVLIALVLRAHWELIGNKTEVTWEHR